MESQLWFSVVSERFTGDCHVGSRKPTTNRSTDEIQSSIPQNEKRTTGLHPRQQQHSMRQLTPNYSLLEGAMTPKEESNSHLAEETTTDDEHERPNSFESMLREVSEMSGLHCEDDGLDFGEDSWCSSSSDEMDMDDLRAHLQAEHQQRGCCFDSRLPEVFGEKSFSENMSSSSIDWEDDEENNSPLSCKSGLTETTHTSSLASISILDSDDSDSFGEDRDEPATPTVIRTRRCDKTVRFPCVRFCADPPQVRYYEPAPLSAFNDLWYTCHQLQQMMNEYYTECAVKLQFEEEEATALEEQPLEF